MDTLDRIEALIQERGWSKSEFFRRLGLPNNTLSLWRRGLNSSWREHLPRMAGVLGTTTDYLSGRTDDPAPLTPPEQQLMARMKGLNKADYDYVLGLLMQTADQVIGQLRAEQDARLPGNGPEDDPPRHGGAR